MDRFTASDLRSLAERRDGPCVSITMPTHVAGPESEQDLVRLKNLVRRAEAGLTAQGVRGAEARRLLAPALELPDNPDYWSRRAQGLALYAAPGLFRSFRTPLELDESVVVNRRFQLKPLVPLLNAGGRFFLLALSRNQARLFEATLFGIVQRTVEGMPSGVEETLRSDHADVERGMQVHSATRGRGKQAAVFHGHGGIPDALKDSLVQYFREVDAALRPVLRDERAPLVLAGVESELPLFRDVCSYGAVAEQAVAGNPDHSSPMELHRRALPLVQKLLDQPRQEALNKARELAGSEKMSTDVRHIAPAAAQGKIDTLLLAPNVRVWGRFDQQQLSVDVRSEPGPEDDDLLDFAAVQTALARGAVYLAAQDELPDPKSPAAAIFRY